VNLKSNIIVIFREKRKNEKEFRFAIAKVYWRGRLGKERRRGQQSEI
jgi:tRNA G37 N-methylase Trm5